MVLSKTVNPQLLQHQHQSLPLLVSPAAAPAVVHFSVGGNSSPSTSSSSSSQSASVSVSLSGPVAGSSFAQLGGSQAAAFAFFPRPAQGQSQSQDFDEGRLEVKVSFASHLLLLRGSAGGSDVFDDLHEQQSAGDDDSSAHKAALERLLSYAVADALKPAVRLSSYPKTVLSVSIVLLQSSVQDLSAAINAATLALADAAVELRDLVSSYTLEQQLESDPSSFSCTVAAMCNADDLTYLKTSGTREAAVLLATIALTKQQCQVVRVKMSECLKESLSKK